MTEPQPSNELRHAIGVPDGSPVIVVDGIRIAVAREGHGPVIVCLHAIGHGGRDFEALTAALNGQNEMIRIDWPGQGRSGPDREPPTAQRYANLLAGVLEQLQVSAPVIIGNSIGGAAAIHYAKAKPVRALVLCDPGGLFEITPAVRRICTFFARFFAAGARRAWWYKPAFAFYYRLVLPSPKAAPQRRRIVRAAFEIAPLLRDAWTGFARPEADIREMAADLDVPIWFAWAKSDRVIPLRYAAPAIAKLKDVRVSRFTGGHAAFLERPRQFRRELVKFLRSLEAGRRPASS